MDTAPEAPQTLRILVVDDSVVVRKLAVRHLGKVSNFEMLSPASRGRSALEFLSAKDATVDLVILDMEMPGLSGFDTLDAIMRRHPKVRVIMFSAGDARAEIKNSAAIRLGASFCVRKPQARDGAESAWAVIIEYIYRLFPGARPPRAARPTPSRVSRTPTPSPVTVAVEHTPASAPPSEPISALPISAEEHPMQMWDVRQSRFVEVDPDAPKPTAPKPTAAKPTAAKPTAPKPTAPKPTAAKPTAPKPTAERPAAARRAPTQPPLLIQRTQTTVPSRPSVTPLPIRATPTPLPLRSAPTPLPLRATPTPAPARRRNKAADPERPGRRKRPKPSVLIIGASTGGPKALRELLSSFGHTPKVPMLIVQHMPPTYTRQLAEDLSRRTRLKVREAVDGEPLPTGEVLIAPGGFHMRLKRKGLKTFVHLDQGPPVNFVRPAVDCLLESAAQIFGGGVVVAILTGMGHDGLDGCRTLAEAGATVLVQDEKSATIWGMPGSVAQAGLASAQLNPTELGARLSGLDALP